VVLAHSAEVAFQCFDTVAVLAAVELVDIDRLETLVENLI